MMSGDDDALLSFSIVAIFLAERNYDDHSSMINCHGCGLLFLSC